MKYFPFLTILLGLAAGCAQVSLEARTQVTGIAAYKERIALPPDAVLVVTLEDVSKADARSEVLGQTRIEGLGSPPFQFAIAYDPSRVVPRNRYVVRAKILAGGRLLFIADRSYPVVLGQRNDIALQLRRVGGAPAAADETLENTYWKLIRLGDAPVTAAEKQREPHIMLHPASRRVTGSGGCNRITGSFEQQGDRLTFGRMAATLMACQDEMGTEKLFLETLGKASRFRISRQHLELLDAAGSVLADLEAVHLR